MNGCMLEQEKARKKGGCVILDGWIFKCRDASLRMVLHKR